MISELHEIEAAISGSTPVSKADYLSWARSSDLATQARAYHLSTHAWERIAPEPAMDEHCEATADFLLACISTNPDLDDFIPSGFIAAHELASCLKHWSLIEGTSGLIAGVAKKLESLYRASDTNGRNRIEWGALEHILEAPRLRPYFDAWAQDDELRQAHERALEWGLAHSKDDTT